MAQRAFKEVFLENQVMDRFLRFYQKRKLLWGNKSGRPAIPAVYYAREFPDSSVSSAIL